MIAPARGTLGILDDDSIPFDAPADTQPAGPEPIIIDRSTLERYGECPAQGQMIERGDVVTASPEADAGEAVHQVVANIAAMVADGWTDAAELREHAYDALLKSRPDIQGEALDGMRASLWAVIRFLLYYPSGEPRHPADLICFDGGQGEQSSQLSWDIFEHDGRPVRLTSELDLLTASDSDEELEDWDYKSGHKVWSATDVRQSFQFGIFHPWLIFTNYGTCKRVHVRVWNTRFNIVTGRVTFDRDRDFARMHANLESRVRLYLEHHDSLLPAPAWPGPAKCAMCDAAALCPEARGEIRDVKADPEKAARQLIALEASAAKLRKALTAHVDAAGTDIVIDGKAFGRNKPRAAPKRKPSAGWYPVAGGDDEEGGGDE